MKTPLPLNEEYDWRTDPHWLSFAEHMAAALKMVWEHEQKVARDALANAPQAQAGAPSAAAVTQFEQAKREAVATRSRRVAHIRREVQP